MAKDKGLKPGQTAPASGQYVQVGPRGGHGHEVTVTKGEPMPPSPKPGMTYDLVDPSKNKSGQGK
jgi:YjzC-like protein